MQTPGIVLQEGLVASLVIFLLPSFLYGLTIGDGLFLIPHNTYSMWN